MGAAKQAFVRDGKDPSIMDLDPEKSIASQRGVSNTKKVTAKPKPKKKIKRKKIYWNTVDEENVGNDSIWGMITSEGEITMKDLKFDEKEFEELFTDQGKPTQKKKQSGGKSKKEEKKKSVSVIEGKRAMNGGIILARIKVSFQEVAERVNNM